MPRTTHEDSEIFPRRGDDQCRKLLEAHYAGAIPLGLLKSEQDRITTDLDTLEQRLSVSELKSNSSRPT